MCGYKSLEEYVDLCKYDIRFMLISNWEKPTKSAFQRFFNDSLIGSVDDVFFDLSNHVCDLMDIKKNIKQYIDGTKLEANANKNTFVYKTRIINARRKLYNKITESILMLNLEFGYCYKIKQYYNSYDMGYIAQYLMDVMVSNDIDIAYGKGKRKSIFQRYYDTFLGYHLKLSEYEYWLFEIGDNRNSCSKTDHDATMCATKIDYYNNTGITKPCYNAQIAVSDGIIVNAELYQNPADVKTFIPFMERYNEYNGEYPLNPMADAGYGSYDNYMYCIEKGMNPVMKYPMYAKKNESKFKKKTGQVINWETDEYGHKICSEGHVFDQELSDKYDDESGKYLKISKQFTSLKSCEGCPKRNECYRGTKETRTISRNEIMEQFYGYVDETLSSEFGMELKKQRTIQVEGAFGVIKQNFKFTRFTRRGKENAKMEFLLVCLGYNIKKYHYYRLKKEKESKNNDQIN
jgi:hypothetical protein